VQLTPSLNDTVMLHDVEGREYPSRIEGVEDGVLTVGKPLNLLQAHKLGPGSSWLLSWSVKAGIAVLPTRLVAEFQEKGLGLWSLTVTGASWVEQRRRFVRVPAFGRVLLHPCTEDAELAPVRGTLIDLSEGGLRCSVERSLAHHPTLDADVVARFHFGDLEFAVTGRVTTRRDEDRPVPVTHLVVVFEEPNPDADALRKEIFAQQRRIIRPA